MRSNKSTKQICFRALLQTPAHTSEWNFALCSLGIIRSVKYLFFFSFWITLRQRPNLPVFILRWTSPPLRYIVAAHSRELWTKWPHNKCSPLRQSFISILQTASIRLLKWWQVNFNIVVLIFAQSLNPLYLNVPPSFLWPHVDFWPKFQSWNFVCSVQSRLKALDLVWWVIYCSRDQLKRPLHVWLKVVPRGVFRVPLWPLSHVVWLFLMEEISV